LACDALPLGAGVFGWVPGLAGSEKSVSFGQQIGHIIGWPARLICRQPPASVASFMAAHTPVRTTWPGLL
jgi:hypothetical protein